MTVKKLLTTLALLLPLASYGQSISPAQIEQFKQLPRAQQESLARQYGVDLDSLTGTSSSSQRPQRVEVVEPLSDIADEEQKRAQAEKEKEDEHARQKAPRAW